MAGGVLSAGAGGLTEWLAGTKGRFVLSLIAQPEVREVFAGFSIEAVETTYSFGRLDQGNGKRGEVLISG